MLNFSASTFITEGSSNVITGLMRRSSEYVIDSSSLHIFSEALMTSPRIFMCCDDCGLIVLLSDQPYRAGSVVGRSGSDR